MDSVKLKRIRIYTDGGCDSNPGGVGAWAFCIVDGSRREEGFGCVENTTNNRMELTAAIRALERLRELYPGDKRLEVEVFTDSQYLSRGMNEWIVHWKRRKWTLKSGLPVKNVELWKQLCFLAHRYRVTWTWIRGHAGDQENVHVDQLVHQAIKDRMAATAELPDEAAANFPEVKLIRANKQPAAIIIKQGNGRAKVRIAWSHLHRLIEELIRILRAGEEN